MAKKTSTKKKTTKKGATTKKVVAKKPLKIPSKNTAKNTAKIEPKIEKTIIEKEDNNTLENGIPREEVVKNTSEKDVLQMLRIPTAESQEKGEEKSFQKEAEPEFDIIRDEDEPFFSDEKEEDPFATDDQKENVEDEFSNFDDYKDMGEGDADWMFSDHALMAEMGVEIIDLLMTTGCMAIAKDFGNDEKYSVPDYKKAKLKKPLAMLLEKRGKTLPPEVMFVLVVIGVYAPALFVAVQERQRKGKEAQAEAEREAQAQVVKKKGRPKGSKDSKPRKAKTITINQNEQKKKDAKRSGGNNESTGKE